MRLAFSPFMPSGYVFFQYSLFQKCNLRVITRAENVITNTTVLKMPSGNKRIVLSSPLISVI